MRQFLLMSSVGCHLCDQAAEIVINNLNPHEYQLDAVDIAYDDLLMEKYALLIPVLLDELSGRELRWPFDASQLQHFIAGFE